MNTQSSKQNQVNSLLAEIFIAPSNEIRTDRFCTSESGSEAPCRCSGPGQCSGGCGASG